MNNCAAMQGSISSLHWRRRRSIRRSLIPSLNLVRSRSRLCGIFRPGHFRGVATVVCKLFNMVQPDVAFFGQKDFQQCAVVRRMSVDLNLPIEIVTVPTVREPDGLAMSSRNRYLSAPERNRALAISRGLLAAETEFRAGERDPVRLLSIVRRHLEPLDELQYLEIVDAETLKPATNPFSRPVAICAAGYVGSTRLIDNVVLDPDARQQIGRSQLVGLSQWDSKQVQRGARGEEASNRWRGATRRA
ncbi:pantoate--beta-alanine ligase [Bradyrhizobium sp. LM2.9]